MDADEICQYGNVTDVPIQCRQESKLHHTLRTIQAPMTLLSLTLAVAVNAGILFGLRRAKRKAITAILLSWISITALTHSLLTQVPVLINLIGKAWLLGDVISVALGYIITTIAICNNVFLLMLSAIRIQLRVEIKYMAVARPCMKREASLFNAWGVAVTFAVIVSVFSAGLPFLSHPNFVYVRPLLRPGLTGSWASKATSAIFLVIPNIITCCLAAATVLKIRVKRWLRLGWTQRRTQIRMPRGSIRPAVQEIRASRGIATVLLSTGVFMLVCCITKEIAFDLPATDGRSIVLFISENVHCICAIVRSFLFIATSPVLLQQIMQWLFSSPDQQATVHPQPRNFKLLHQGMAALTPPLHHGHPILKTCHGVRIRVQDEAAERDGSSTSSVSHAVRRLSSVSTLTCEVFCDRDKESCTISISGDCEIKRSRTNMKKQISNSTDSFGDYKKTHTSRHSLTDCPADSFLSSSNANFTNPAPTSHMKRKGQSSQNHRQSTVSLNSLSPLDVRFITSMDGSKMFDRKAHGCQATANQTWGSLPSSVSQRHVDGDVLPPKPKIAFCQDSEPKDGNPSAVRIDE